MTSKQPTDVDEKPGENAVQEAFPAPGQADPDRQAELLRKAQEQNGEKKPGSPVEEIDRIKRYLAGPTAFSA